MEFPGTITVPPEVLMDTLRGYCQSLAAHGFEQLVLLPTHGGNFAPVNTVAPEIAREFDAAIIPLAELDELMQLMNAGLRDAGIEYEEPVIHAGAAETAVVLAVAEGLVRREELERGHEGPVDVTAVRRGVSGRHRERCARGPAAGDRRGRGGDSRPDHRRVRRAHRGRARGRRVTDTRRPVQRGLSRLLAAGSPDTGVCQASDRASACRIPHHIAYYCRREELRT